MDATFISKRPIREKFSIKGAPSWSRFFVLSVGVALALTGLAKIYAAFGSARLLEIEDPILGVSYRHLMFVIGLLEIGLSCLCLFTKIQYISIVMVAWVATNFLLYRICLWFIDWRGACPCLGSLTDALHISSHTVDIFAKLLLAYMLAGSYLACWYLWRKW
jgi:hypothetical protein